MKRLLVALFFVMLASSTHAALTDWTVDISLNDDKTSDWLITLQYDTPVDKTDYFVFARLTDYEVFADGAPLTDCTYKFDFGTSIQCNNIYATNITYVFKTNQVINDVLQNFRLFSQRLPVTRNTLHYSVIIRLPVGSILADANYIRPAGLKPVEPEFGQQDTDGRRIFIRWFFDNPTLGQTFNPAVVYEQVSSVGQNQLNVFIVIISGAIVAFVFLLYFFFKRGNVKDVLPILSDGERKVMEILLREKGTVDQRQIVKETDFSKAKVSRVITDLVNRGLIEKHVKGRKNLIKLKKAIKAEKIVNKESAENKAQKS